MYIDRHICWFVNYANISKYITQKVGQGSAKKWISSSDLSFSNLDPYLRGYLATQTSLWVFPFVMMALAELHIIKALV